MTSYSNFVLFILKIECCHNSKVWMSCLYKANTKQQRITIEIAIQCRYIQLPDQNNSIGFRSYTISGYLETNQNKPKKNSSRKRFTNKHKIKWIRILCKTKRTKSNLHSIWHILALGTQHSQQCFDIKTSSPHALCSTIRKRHHSLILRDRT